MILFQEEHCFNLKQGEMHKLYEDFRKLEPSSNEATEISDRMFELSKSLEVPKDIGKVVSKR